MSLEIQERPLGDPALDALVEAAVAELHRRYRVPGVPDEPYHLADDAVCHVAFVDGVPVGCIARVDAPLDADSRAAPRPTVEMKRVFVDERFRGRGLARALVAAFEDAARGSGAGRVRLETGTKQPEAMALYEALGYERLARNFGQWADEPLTVCYAKTL